MPSDKIVNSVKQLILSSFNKTGYSLIKLPPEKDRQKPLAATSDSSTSDIEKPVQNIFRPDWDCLSADELLLLSEQKKKDPAALYDLSRFFLGMDKENEAMHCCGQSLSLSITPAAQQQQLSSLQKGASNRSITLSGKRMVVTGGASGIGKAIVERLVQMGAHVIAIDKNDDALDALALLIPQATPISLDLSDLERIADTATKIGDVDVVILNAAIYEEVDFLDLDTADVLRLMQNNFLGHVTLAQHHVSMAAAEFENTFSFEVDSLQLDRFPQSTHPPHNIMLVEVPCGERGMRRIEELIDRAASPSCFKQTR